MGERHEPVRTDRNAARTGDPRADETLLLVERLRELRRRRRLGELNDQELSQERLRLLERRTRAVPWHGPERRTRSGQDADATPSVGASGPDPLEPLRKMAASVVDEPRRNRAATLLDALDRTRREGYQQVNGVTMTRRAARFAERELDQP